MLAKVDPKFKEGYTEPMNRPEAEQTLLDTLANAVAIAEAAPTFAEVWRGGRRSLEAHTEKRIAQGHITDEADYTRKIAETVRTAERYRLAKGGYEPMTAVVADSWVAIYTIKGQIVTAYAVEANQEDFAALYARKGWKVDKVKVNGNIRTESERLYLRYRNF